MAATTLYYGDDEALAVELGDQVDVRVDGVEFEGGRITAIHIRSREVTVRYPDYRDTTRAGDPRTKSRRVPVAAVDLIAREM